MNIGEACGGACCFSNCIEKETGAAERCTYCKPGLLCYGDLSVVSMKGGVCGRQMEGRIKISVITINIIHQTIPLQYL